MVSMEVAAADTPEAKQLLTDYFRLRAETFPGNAYTTVFPTREAFTAPAGVFVIVRDEQGEDVGCGGIRALADTGSEVRYEIKHLFLKPSTRGRGWGRLLIDDLIERARTFGATEVVLDTHHTLEAAAGLYAATGFIPIEPYNDNPNATRWYGKTLR